MPFVKVDNSSLIESLDRHGDKVIVEFKSNGTKHSYAGIPEDVWVDWIAAPSAGSFFHQFIKGQYDSQKL